MSTGSASRPTPGSVSVWIHDLKNGDETAARKLFDRYFPNVRHVARRRLNGFPTRIVDDEDLALDVIATLFRGFRLGRFDRLKNRVHLWGLLLWITTEQIIDHKRWESREKRDVKKVRDSVASDSVEICDDEPSPHLLAEFNDQLQRLFDILLTDELRQIAAAKLEGYDNGEISQLLAISKRTVQRKVNQIHACWERELG